MKIKKVSRLFSVVLWGSNEYFHESYGTWSYRQGSQFYFNQSSSASLRIIYLTFQMIFCLARILTLKTIRVTFDRNDISILLKYMALPLWSLAPSSMSSYQFPNNSSSPLSGKGLEQGKIKPSRWVSLMR